MAPHRDFELRPGEALAVGDAEDERAAARFRDVLGRFATGVTVVTGMAGFEPVGMTCQSFASLSLSPPLVLFCPAKSSRAWPLMRAWGHFCVNLLAADQQGVSEVMATRGADKFAEVAWSPSPLTGSPLLAGGLGYVDCAIEAVHEAGDHFVVVGRVLDLAATGREPPLLYFRGEYGAPGAAAG